MYKVRFKSWEELPPEYREDVKKDDLTPEHGYDIDLSTGFVHLVDPKRPELYDTDASVMVPASLLLALAVSDDTMTIEEV